MIMDGAHVTAALCLLLGKEEIENKKKLKLQSLPRSPMWLQSQMNMSYIHTNPTSLWFPYACGVIVFTSPLLHKYPKPVQFLASEAMVSWLCWSSFCIVKDKHRAGTCPMSRRKYWQIFKYYWAEVLERTCVLEDGYCALWQVTLAHSKFINLKAYFVECLLFCLSKLYSAGLKKIDSLICLRQ